MLASLKTVRDAFFSCAPLFFSSLAFFFLQFLRQQNEKRGLRKELRQFREEIEPGLLSEIDRKDKLLVTLVSTCFFRPRIQFFGIPTHARGKYCPSSFYKSDYMCRVSLLNIRTVAFCTNPVAIECNSRS